MIKWNVSFHIYTQYIFNIFSLKYQSSEASFDFPINFVPSNHYCPNHRGSNQELWEQVVVLGQEMCFGRPGDSQGPCPREVAAYDVLYIEMIILDQWMYRIVQVYRGCGASKLNYESRRKLFNIRSSPEVFKDYGPEFFFNLIKLNASNLWCWWTFQISHIPSIGDTKTPVAIGIIDRFVHRILSFAEVMIQQQNLGGWLVVWSWLSILALLHVYIFGIFTYLFFTCINDKYTVVCLVVHCYELNIPKWCLYIYIHSWI